MPDAAGNFKGISVPELPWQRDKKPGSVTITVGRKSVTRGAGGICGIHKRAYSGMACPQCTGN
jgi:hypothetical protein